MRCKNKILTLLVCLLAIVAINKKAGALNDVHVVLFILDGTPKDFLYDSISDGSLPNLKEYFWDNGAHAISGISTFPSASAPAYQSYITGLFAGRSGIPYLEWFDRKNDREVDYLGKDYKHVNKHLWNLHAEQNADEQFNTPVTIFDKLAGYPTASIYSEVSKGARDSHPKIPLGALSDTFITNKPEHLDVRALKKIMKHFSQSEEKIPKFTLVGLYSADVLQHYEGANSKNAKFVLVQFDKFLGEFITLLKTRGIFDKTYIVVVADHGMHNIDHDVKLSDILSKIPDKFIGERGVSSAHIYIKQGDKTAPIEPLRNSQYISLVIAKKDFNHVDVFSKECKSTITKINVKGETYYGYKPANCDPLNYCSEQEIKNMCDGKLYDNRTWLAKTWNQKYPDGVVQLGQIFDDGRAGDIFAVADDKGGFYREKVATHGSLIDADMNVPMLVMGPNIAKGEFGPARTVDLFPTMLSWFGLPKDNERDGVAFWNNEKVDEENLKLARALDFMLDKPPLLKSPNPDLLRTEFNKNWPKFSEKELSEEIAKQSKLIKKYKNELATLRERDLRYQLISDQLEKAQKDIRRLEDVKDLLPQKKPGSFSE